MFTPFRVENSKSNRSNSLFGTQIPNGDNWCKMNFQIVNKPIYNPPIPNIQIQPNSSLVNVGSIFSPFKPTGPCSSCG